MHKFTIGKYYVCSNCYIMCFPNAEIGEEMLSYWNSVGQDNFPPPFGPVYKKKQAISWNKLKEVWDEKFNTDLKCLMPGVPFFVTSNSKTFVQILAPNHIGWIAAEELVKPFYKFRNLNKVNFTTTLAEIQESLGLL